MGVCVCVNNRKYPPVLPIFIGERMMNNQLMLRQKWKRLQVSVPWQQQEFGGVDQ